MRILCFNAGSSSLRASGFVVDEPAAAPQRVFTRHIERIERSATADAHGEHVAALAAAAADADHAGFGPVDVTAHRFVHGGPSLLDHAIVDTTTRDLLDHARSFAPLHLARELAVLDATVARYPNAVHVACLDTAFHRDLPAVARRLPIPAALDHDGIRRYGFHGLSYEYLVHHLDERLGSRAVLAHLGNGASLAAVRDGVSCDTTMGLTPTGGLVMGTRTGDTDPGVLVHLARARGFDADALEHLVDYESGLLGISSRSGDVRDLIDARAAGDDAAALALDVFEISAAKHVAALTTVLVGIDTLVFTGGIGQNAAEVRAGIAARLAHLGVTVEPAANRRGAHVISRADAPVTVRVEPTDEEAMMALHAIRLTSAR